MNRRSFLKRMCLAVASIAVAPPVLSELIPQAKEFADGGMVAPLDPWLVGERMEEALISSDYYSIQWPIRQRLWEYGTFISEDTLECRIYFEGGGSSAYIPDELSTELRKLFPRPTAHYVDENGKATPKHPLNFME